MWRSTTKSWPADHEPVAVWERDRLFVAKRVNDQWFECSEYGDVSMSNMGGAMACDPEYWQSLPIEWARGMRSAWAANKA